MNADIIYLSPLIKIAVGERRVVPEESLDTHKTFLRLCGVCSAWWI